MQYFLQGSGGGVHFVVGAPVVGAAVFVGTPVLGADTTAVLPVPPLPDTPPPGPVLAITGVGDGALLTTGAEAGDDATPGATLTGSECVEPL